MKRVLRQKDLCSGPDKRSLEHLPYEEGIKTPSFELLRFFALLEHLPYEEGIKTTSLPVAGSVYGWNTYPMKRVLRPQP